MDERTITSRQPSDSTVDAAPIWKLRVLYSGSTGIVGAPPKCWDGGAALTIGRGTATYPSATALLLDDKATSQLHANLVLRDHQVILQDLNSKNGTHVNGRRLLPSEQKLIKDDDLIRIGDSLILVRRETAIVSDVVNAALVGVSQAMCKVRCAIASAAPTSNPLLLTGETGTGKEVAATATHLGSKRRGRLVAVNCAATPASLAESMFFGTHRGAFTGAVGQAGFFSEADKGTLFLDEIGDFPADLQPKLLRAIETHQVIPLGSVRPIPCDVRIVAATNRDLDTEMRNQTFRPDLYARLSALVLRMPPVRERREDILLLAQHLGGQTFYPSVHLAAAMLAYDWPLNVREIDNIVKRLTSSTEDDVRRTLEAAIVARSAPTGHDNQRKWAKGDAPPSKNQILRMLKKYQGNVQQIAETFGFSRRHFRRWTDEQNLNPADFRAHGKRADVL